MRFNAHSVALFLLSGAPAVLATTCSAGYFYQNTNPKGCQKCPVGSYTTTTNNANACTPCSDNKTTAGTGSTSSTSCVCAPGYGQYDPTAKTCSACPAGSSSILGATSCGTCASGTYSGSAASSCSPCPKGTFNNKSGQGSCCTCCTGYATTTTGQKSCTKCTGSTTSNSDHSSCTYSSHPPSAPSTCTQSSGGVCPLPNGMLPSGTPPKKRSVACMRGRHQCPHFSGAGGYDCIDIGRDPESCGGCVTPEGIPSPTEVEGLGPAGRDCTAIPNINTVTCSRGKCLITKCRNGFLKVVDDNGEESCVKRPTYHSGGSQNHAAAPNTPLIIGDDSD